MLTCSLPLRRAVIIAIIIILKLLKGCCLHESQSRPWIDSTVSLIWKTSLLQSNNFVLIPIIFGKGTGNRKLWNNTARLAGWLLKINCVFPKFHFAQSNFNSWKRVWQPLKTQMICTRAIAFTEPADNRSGTVIMDCNWCIKKYFHQFKVILKLNFCFTKRNTNKREWNEPRYLGEHNQWRHQPISLGTRARTWFCVKFRVWTVKKDIFRPFLAKTN